jgi:hypothetical protein
VPGEGGGPSIDRSSPSHRCSPAGSCPLTQIPASDAPAPAGHLPIARVPVQEAAPGECQRGRRDLASHEAISSRSASRVAALRCVLACTPSGSAPEHSCRRPRTLPALGSGRPRRTARAVTADQYVHGHSTSACRIARAPAPAKTSYADRGEDRAQSCGSNLLALCL